MIRTFTKTLAVAAVAASLAFAATAQQLPNIVPEQSAMFGSEAKFTSTEAITNYAYEPGYVGGFINSPLQGVQVLHFDEPPEVVWDWVHSGNANWSLQIEELSWDHSASETPGQLGMGSVRRCDFVGGAGTAYERVYAVEENRMIAYDLDPERSTAPLPIRDFFVVWTLEDKGDEGTLVVTRIFFHEAQDMGGNAAAAVGQALAVDFKNFANVYGGTYVDM